MTFHADLKRLGACSDACEWAEQFNTWAECWAACAKPRWLAWICGRVSGEVGSPKRLKLCAMLAEIAALVLPRFEARFPHDSRPRVAVEILAAYARGEATLEDVRAAAADANDAYAAAVLDDDDAYAAAHAALASYATLASYAADAAVAYADAAAITANPQAPP